MLITILSNNQTGATGSVLSDALPFEEFVQAVAFRSSALKSGGTTNTTDTTDTVAVSTEYVAPVNEYAFCEAPSFIEGQIPLWIKQNYSNAEESYLVKFLKEYYNWMYCGFKNKDANLTPYDIEELFDIDRVPDAFLDYYVSTYAPFIELESPLLRRENVRKFINNIKTKFLSSKGIKSSYEYLLKTLFDIDLEKISYPKLGLMRLNGGKFIFQANQMNPSQSIYQSGTITDLPQVELPTLRSPGLNGGVINDNYFWQDYSYLLQTSASVEEAVYYSTTVLKAVHPAGTRVFFEQYVPLDPIDFGDVDDNTDDVVIVPEVREIPVIKNYLPYYPNIDLDSMPINECTCCNSYCDPAGSTTQFRTFADPRWSESIPDTVRYFRDIEIGQFIELYPITDSPNVILTDCPAYGSCSAGV